MRGGGRNTKKKLVKSQISSGPSRALIVTTPFRVSDRMQKEITNYAEDLVYYAVKIENYVVVLEQMTRKNRSITRKKIENYADV